MAGPVGSGLVTINVGALLVLHSTFTRGAPTWRRQRNQNRYDQWGRNGYHRQSREEQNPEELAGLFEGDMNVRPPTRKKRGVLADRFQRWPIGIIPYQFDDSYNEDQKTLILKAMSEITSKTLIRGSRCIFFTPKRDFHVDFLDMKPDIGCYSSVGKISGPQTVSLEPNCLEKGTVMHELLHAVGLWHEQSRTDRDDYVTVNWNNIKEDPLINRRVNFQKYTVQYIDDLGLPYDFDSIMHYGFAFFAKDKYSPTLTPKYPYAYIGQRSHISEIDIKKVQLLYGCGGRTEWDCDFEKRTTCNWKQDTDDDFDWTINRGSTPTAFTGPSGDHTNGLGYYMYGEADGNKGKTARLFSTSIPTKLYCIKFWYHMAGYSIGSLWLRARHQTRTKVLFEKHGHQDDEWLLESKEYQAPTSFQLIFEVKMGNGEIGDIAIDDVSLEPGFCNYIRNFRGIDLP